MEPVNRFETADRTRLENGERSIGDLIRDLRDESLTLLRQEVALAKTEMSEKAAKLIRNLIYLAVGGLIAYAGLIFLILAVTFGAQVGLVKLGLSLDVATWLAPLLVGIIVGIVGYTLVQKAVSTLSNESIVPEKTTESLKEDKQWIEKKVT